MLGSLIPDIRALEMLVSIGRTGSIARAAIALGVSQQAVSSRLQRLEKMVGLILVTRRAHDSVLTKEGVLVVEWSARVLDSAEKLEAGIISLRTDRPDKLSVASSLTVAEHLLPHWIVSMGAHQRAHGREATRISMVVTNAENAARLVTDDEVELGFVEGSTPPVGLRYKRLASDELYLVVSPTHDWAQRDPREVSPEELASTSLVMRERGSGCRAVLEEALITAGIDEASIRPPLLELASNVAILEAVADDADDAGAAAVTFHAARPLIADGRLVRIATPGLRLTRTLGAVWKNGEEPSSLAARELLEHASGGVLS
ncbi:MAG: LysR family transcriptional regulator [Actinomycetales bacterium]|nr:LysR family transcriptional regulator [Actinomycetales bacterium]